ncbi:MAG TPA: N-acetylmuramoyl-L-alanine amidase [Steroidobacteraceae bacterium]|nr:N-acetylmuramoyl-L-alanine amidase [Steroidobacteraceae bacterium]
MFQRLLCRLLPAGVLLLAGEFAGAANAIRAASLEALAADSARLQLQLSAPPRQKVFSLDNPHRVVIDLPAAQLARGLKLPAAAGPVRSLRSGARPDGTLRLVMELDRDLAPRVTASGTQLTVELGSAPAAAAPVPVHAAHAPANDGRDIIVAVDAGHGGEDPGATGASGTHEKDVTLAIARALAKRIDAEPGMHAYLTRDADRFIALRDRIDLARRAHADLFVSIHADSIKDRKVGGSSVYVLSEHGASSEAARWLAEGENAADLKGGVSLGDVPAPLASVLMDLSQTTSITHSMEAANLVLGQLDHVGTIRKSQVQQAGFLVLKSPDIPSMLVETAYISNPAEEKKLRSAAYQAQLAEAILDGLRQYCRDNPPDGTLFARQRAASGVPATIVADSPRP